jgi:hypothetical protein
MPSFQAVSKTTLAGKRWRRTENYAFAAADAVAPLVVKELASALMHFPLGFIKMEEQFVPVAVLGLQQGQNLFVRADGRWIGGYVPAVFRGYPFQLANLEDGKHILAVDVESGLISDTEGELFFDAQGQPSQPLSDVLEFLSQVRSNHEMTLKICQVLADHHLIQPWPITLQGPDAQQQVDGLYRVDEAAMNALPVEAFDALRQTGALTVAYCQLFSMQHLQMLARLAEVTHKARQMPATTASGELDLEFLNKGGTLSFDSL